MNELASKPNIAPPSQDAFEATWYVVGNEIRRTSGKTLKEIQFTEKKVVETFIRLGIQPERRLVCQVTEAFQKRGIEGTELIDNTIHSTLKALTESFHLGVVTNNNHSPMVTQILRRLDLEQLFEIIVVSADVGWQKPRPAIFRHAVNLLRLPPHHVAFVGDEVDADINGSRDFGMMPILVEPHGQHEQRGCTRVKSLRELLTIFES